MKSETDLIMIKLKLMKPRMKFKMKLLKEEPDSCNRWKRGSLTTTISSITNNDQDRVSNRNGYICKQPIYAGEITVFVIIRVF